MESMPSMYTQTRLSKRGSVYYFRTMIPKDFQSHYGKQRDRLLPAYQGLQGSESSGPHGISQVGSRLRYHMPTSKGATAATRGPGSG